MLKFHKTLKSALAKASHLSFVASESAYKKGLYKKVLDEELFSMMSSELKKAEAGLSGKCFNSYTANKSIRTVSFAVLPQKVSRGNSPTRKEWVYKHTASIEKHENSTIILVLDKEDHYVAAASAIARRVRLYSQKTGDTEKRSFHVVAIDASGNEIAPNKRVSAVADGVSWACMAVDTPPSDFNPKAVAAAAKALFKGNKSVSSKEIQGSKLVEEGLNGIFAVGKCAVEAPRMLILDYKPSKASKTVALIGKGVTYDTGGLSLKIQGNMVGMKSDMGGAAAVVGAFKSLVDAKCSHRVIAILGLVENAIGPEAYKNDDIITMHSGKTVEINNTDAEGRIVLADCVSYAARTYELDLVVDAATLTGAQMIATGLLHAGVVSNEDKVEDLAMKAGKSSGDLVSPLPFAPEFFKAEFSSKVADMKNSVKNRMNAQSSCAAQFIHNHIEDTETPWLHIDLAGPSFVGGLGSGFGVALMFEIVENL
ncbi:leucyl aminopeptidase family protein [Pseudobacteriovorax antillogorgiicola]|uniref:Probable aminopeptidase NPEPL1 n=1 Tax=Pseudobacteriovorax antillogorgiicola TaxID=1513793 RepID=A0A1Y6BPR3_9BACT|nr:leucyl aminopeptidase family protein [Pseudobacteriovorax antillogorgiicola]TCS55320.1 putative aminopeptidase NPEPL1 [Pseudobacteriovorax antillogorgiicola]SMF14255.1 probable aminopeptidase NPEPL1 [Pseudobacteriovorax antillogorgiicola]